MIVEAEATRASETRLRFIDDGFPLVLSIAPRVWQDSTIEEMAAGYERYFTRGERYALI